MRRIKAGVLSLLILILSFAAGGCMSYHDPDKLTYVTAMLLDVTADKKPVIYFETFVPVRSAARETSDAVRKMFAVQGNTVSQCLGYLQGLTNYHVTLAHCKVLLISKEAVKAGLRNYIDGFIRQEDFVNRTRFVVLDDDVRSFTDLQLGGERLTGLYIFDLLEEQYPLVMGTQANLLSFLNQNESGSRIITMPMVAINVPDMDEAPSTIPLQGQPSSSQPSSSQPSSGQPSSGQPSSSQPSSSQPSSSQPSSSQSSSSQSSSGQSSSGGGNNVGGSQSGGGMGLSGATPNGNTRSGGSSGSGMECKITGIALVTIDGWVDSLDQNSAFYYNLITNPPKTGTIEVPNPSAPGKYVTLGILCTRNKTTGAYQNGRFRYTVRSQVTTMFTEAQDRIDLQDDGTVRKVEKNAEKLLGDRCRSLFAQYQAKGDDIFWIQNAFDRMVPRKKGTSIIGDTDFSIQFQVSITSTHKKFTWS